MIRVYMPPRNSGVEVILYNVPRTRRSQRRPAQQIFDVLVRDFSKYALQLYSKPSSTEKQMELCMKMLMKPVVDTARFDRIWQEHVYALKGQYKMSD